jgi:3-hydroxybenzoate 6-monooxygenase
LLLGLGNLAKGIDMSSVRNVRPVVVAGGGIGGLACALGLAIKGFRILLLEQAQEFGLGAGIQLAPNAWSALDALGAGERVKHEAVFIERCPQFSPGLRYPDVVAGYGM